MERSGAELFFWEHLDELRSRLIKSIVAVAAGSGLFYAVLDRCLEILIRPVGHLVFVAPYEAFVARMTLTLIGGFILALPVVLYQVWQFVGSGLTENERQHIRVYGPLSFICFLSGVAFAYFIMIPLSMNFFLGFSSPLMQPMITVEKYISFVGMMVFVFGIVFELPLVLVFLAKIGIATPEFLRQKRRYAIVAILIISAILTPPDVASQMLMAVPLIILYELGILCVSLTTK